MVMLGVPLHVHLPDLSVYAVIPESVSLPAGEPFHRYTYSNYAISASRERRPLEETATAILGRFVGLPLKGFEG